jgi:GT2 family glycosyltransferase
MVVNTAAVVVRWRGGDEVDRCLKSLIEHGGEDLKRIVLVDSGSGDGGADRIACEFEQVEVVALAENRSFGWAVEKGVQRCDEALLLILNPDASLMEGSLGTLCEALRQMPTAAGVVPLLVDPTGRSQHGWQLRRLPGALRLASGLPGPPLFSGEPPQDTVPVEQPAAAAWLVRRELWLALDGFDPEFAPAWWEDVDFCARLMQRLGEPGFPARAGFSVVPNARVFHGGGSSLIELSRVEFLTAFYSNLLRYAERHQRRRLRLIRGGLRLSLVARAIARPRQRRDYLQVVRTISDERREG